MKKHISERGLLPKSLPGSRGCQRLHPLSSSSETHLVGCVSHARLHVPRSTAILCTLSKTDRVVLITWQLVKTQMVTRNKPKIHVIYYITLKLWEIWSFLTLLLLSGLLLIVVVVTFMVKSMGQIGMSNNLTVCKEMTDAM